LVALSLLLGQDSGLVFGLLGCGLCRRLCRLTFGLRCEFSRPKSLLGQLGFLRSLCSFTFGGASGSFCLHCLSRRPTRSDYRIVRPWLGAEPLQHRLFRLRGIVLPLPEIRGHVPFHSGSLACSAIGMLVGRLLDGSINTQTILGLYALSPAYDSGFDPRARYSISPIAAPSPQEWDYIRPDVILAKNLK
jgi:hypothetical protein